MQENMDQKNSDYRHFLRSALESLFFDLIKYVEEKYLKIRMLFFPKQPLEVFFKK